MKKIDVVPIKHSFEVGESRHLVIAAHEEYSSNSVAVKQHQSYQISCDTTERWQDWLIFSSAKGYFNPLAWMAGMRVRKTKCFCLCGVYDKQDRTGFAVGLEHSINVTENSNELYFFANDTKNFYFNNYGSLTITVTRVN